MRGRGRRQCLTLNLAYVALSKPSERENFDHVMSHPATGVPSYDHSVSRRVTVADYETLLDALADAVWVKDREGHFVSVNALTARWLGKTRHELLTGEPDSYAPPEITARWMAEDRWVMENGAPLTVVEVIPDGMGGRHIETMKAPLTDRDGRIIGTVGSARDISAHKAIEAQLRLLSIGVSSSPIGVLICAADGRVEYANATACDLAHTTTDQLLGEVVWSFPWWRNAEESLRVARAAVASATVWDGVVPAARHDHSTFEGHIRVVPVVSERTLSHVVVTLEDITERVELERRLQASERMEAVGRLAGGIAHDLRNILTAIMGFTELLRSEVRTSTGAAYAKEVLAAVGRANALATHLLTFSRHQHLPCTTLDLNEVLERNATMLAQLIGDSAELHVTLSETPAWVFADETRLVQVLTNLIVNARDAVRVPGRIDLVTLVTKSTNEVRLTVTDNGIGMSAEVRDRAFEPFFTTKAPGKGTGLGLATVHGIVKQLGGDVQLHANPSGGTVVLVTLPLVPYTPERKTSVPAIAASAAHVVLIDDDASVRNICTRALAGAGYRVTSLDGAQLEETQLLHLQGPVDVVVSDVTMPKISGDAAVAILRTRWPTLPAIFISGYVAQSLALPPLTHHTRFLEKPLLMSTLLAEVEAVLRTDVDGRHNASSAKE